MTCYYCPLSENISGLDDIKVVTLSMPPKIRCTRTNEYNDLYHKCEFDFDIVRHGHWIPIKGSDGKDYVLCSVCAYPQKIIGVKNYCTGCGAKMD